MILEGKPGMKHFLGIQLAIRNFLPGIQTLLHYNQPLTNDKIL